MSKPRKEHRSELNLNLEFVGFAGFFFIVIISFTGDLDNRIPIFIRNICLKLFASCNDPNTRAIV